MGIEAQGPSVKGCLGSTGERIGQVKSAAAVKWNSPVTTTYGDKFTERTVQLMVGGILLYAACFPEAAAATAAKISACALATIKAVGAFFALAFGSAGLPVTLPIIAVVALVGVGVYLYKNPDKRALIAQKAADAYAAVKGFATTVGTTVADQFRPVPEKDVPTAMKAFALRNSNDGCEFRLGRDTTTILRKNLAKNPEQTLLKMAEALITLEETGVDTTDLRKMLKGLFYDKDGTTPHAETASVISKFLEASIENEAARDGAAKQVVDSIFEVLGGNDQSKAVMQNAIVAGMDTVAAQVVAEAPQEVQIEDLGDVDEEQQPEVVAQPEVAAQPEVVAQPVGVRERPIGMGAEFFNMFG